MKTKSALYLSALYLLASCASISHVTDDDVYVMKAPTLSNSSSVTDESSYDNYRYRREQGDYDVQYGWSTRPSIIWMSPYVYNQPGWNYGLGYNYYAPFGYNYYDPFAYNHYYYGDWSSPYYYGYNNYWYPYNYGYGLGYYGNPYYNNYYSNNGNNNNWNKEPKHANTSYKPRNSMSGVNNPRRPTSSGMSGMVKQGNQGRRSSQNAQVNSRPGASLQGTQGKPGYQTENLGSARRKSVQEGQGLARPNEQLNTRTNPQGFSNRNEGGTNRPSTGTHRPSNNENQGHSRPNPVEMNGGSNSPARNGTNNSPSPAGGTGRRGGGL